MTTEVREMNPVRVVDKAVLPMVPINDEVKTSWLAGKRVRLVNEKRIPLNLAEVVKMFFDQGINISSAIPLEGYTYAGLGVQDADAETALRSILGAVGLDYELDDPGRTVLIRPMASRSWKINVGDRKTSFTSSTAGGMDMAGQGQGTTGAGATTGTATGAASGITGGAAGAQGQATAQSGSAGNQSSPAGGGTGGANGGGTTSTSDDFWTTLRAELKDRMEVLMPGVAVTSADMTMVGQPGAVVPAPAPLAPQAMAAPGMGGAANQAADFYVKKKVGTFALNPVTGNVTVQGPRWLLNDLDKYIKKIQAEYSYRITFVGQMVLVTTSDANSEGLDIAAFGRFAQSRYGVAYSNNALGGVTVNFPNGGAIPSIAANGQAVAGTLLGLRSPLDGLQVFNAYLQNFGTVNIIQRPILVTSKGVPGYFSRTSRKYFVQFAQTAAAGNTGAAAVASSNQLIPFDFGTTLTISANYDVDADLVRANIILDQVVQSGTQSVPQLNGTQQVSQDIPLPSTFKYRGEVPLHDGDLIVIGGQSEDETNSSDAGVPGLKNGPLSAVFGQKNSTKSVGTYYFALRVKLTKTD